MHSDTLNDTASVVRIPHLCAVATCIMDRCSRILVSLPAEDYDWPFCQVMCPEYGFSSISNEDCVIDYHLGLDFGTSGARASVIDRECAVIWTHQLNYADGSGLDPSAWREALYTLLAALPEHLAACLAGLAIDGTSGTVLLCDEDLAPVSPALRYDDQRAQQQADWLKGIAPPGHVVCSATSGLAKFLWLTQQGYTVTPAWFLHQADWLSALLGAQPGISDHHNALKSGYDVERLCWPDWVQALPHAHLLPRVLAPGDVIGVLAPDVASRFGIHPGCQIHAGTTDSTAAFIATGVRETGVGVTSLGSTLVLKQLARQRIEAPEYGVYSHRYGNLWLVGGASNAGAAVLRQHFDDARLVELSLQIDPLSDSPLHYYPLTKAGERFPVNDALLEPKLEPRPEDDVDFLHGLLQGLAEIEVAGYARLAGFSAPPLERVVTNGGGAVNPVWREMRQRLLGVPVSSVALDIDAAYGSALLSAGLAFDTA